MSNSQLSVMLTAKGNLESELRSARDRVKDLSKEIGRIQASGGTVGDDLAGEFRQASLAAQKLGTEVSQTNRKIKAATGQSTAAAAKLGRAWQRTAGIFSNNVVAGISAVGVALAGRQAIRAYASAETMQMQLNLAYQKFPAIANASRESFDSLNRALMNATGADDDALASAEGLLARFRLTGTEIQALIPLVNDYSVATGTELVASAETIGKALMGNARALKALGIDFKATGDRGKDLGSIMTALEQKVGGAADAFGQTTQGKMAIAQANFENLQEEIGGALVPALEAVVSIVKPLSETFSGLSDPVKRGAVAVTALGTAALIATPHIIAFKAAMKQAGVSGVAVGKGGLKAAAGIAAITGAMVAMEALKDESGNFFTQEDVYAAESYGFALRDIVQPGWMGTIVNGLQGITDFFVPHNTYMDDARKKVSELDSSMARMVADGSASEAGRQFSELVREAASWGGTVDDVRAQLPAYIQALKDTSWATSSLASAQTRAASSAQIMKRAQIGLAKGLVRADNILARRQAVRDYGAALEAFVAKPSKETGEAVIAAATNAANSFKNPRRQARFVKEAYEDIETAVSKSNLPSDIQGKITSPLNAANAAALRLLASLRAVRLAQTVRNAGATEVFRAAGGPVWGPGTATSDSIPARLSNGEYVLRASAVRALGMGTLHKLNRADKMSDPALLSRLGASRGEPVPVASGGPLIGSIVVHNPASGIDVEKAVVHGLARAERIKRERGV